MKNNSTTSATTKKFKIKKRTWFTFFAMINIVWYTIVVLISNFHDHAIQAELTVAWFSAWTVELALLFGIKVRTKDSCDDDSVSSTTDTSVTVTNTNTTSETTTTHTTYSSDDGGVG